MRYHSTTGQCPDADFREVLFRGLAPDGGLYMPDTVPPLDATTLRDLSGKSVPEIALDVITPYVPKIPRADLSSIVADALNFDIPLRHLEGDVWLLELFHGPTFAFKDVGARTMSRLMSWYLREESQPLTVLVATSGDTGSAVAHAFLGLPKTRVVILYPQDQVSPLQEKQFTTLGENIEALAVQGTFDDCQRMAKSAFADVGAQRDHRLTSANSINMGRLLPQAVYYFWARAQLPAGTIDPVFCTPSGNFGNLCAGLIAKRMGMACEGFIAATNANDVVPQYLDSGEFVPRASQRTISNAMDVGNPSNFVRILELYGRQVDAIRADIVGSRHDDDATREAIRDVHERTGMVLDPHTAVGYLGVREHANDRPVILLATAHPAKFRESVEPAIGREVELPDPLRKCLERESRAVPITPDLDALLVALDS